MTHWPAITLSSISFAYSNDSYQLSAARHIPHSILSQHFTNIKLVCKKQHSLWAPASSPASFLPSQPLYPYIMALHPWHPCPATLPKKNSKSKRCADAVNDTVTASGTAQVQKCWTATLVMYWVGEHWHLPSGWDLGWALRAMVKVEEQDALGVQQLSPKLISTCIITI